MLQKAPTGRCPQCKTDDLMKLHEETGCEYGVDWYIPEILKNHLEPVNEERIFKAMIEDCYPNNTRIAWIKLNTVEILKEVRPCDWETACNDIFPIWRQTNSLSVLMMVQLTTGPMNWRNLLGKTLNKGQPLYRGFLSKQKQQGGSSTWLTKIFTKKLQTKLFQTLKGVCPSGKSPGKKALWDFQQMFSPSLFIQGLIP